jgi:protein phosphatase
MLLVESRTGKARAANEDRYLCEPDLPLYAVLDGCGAGGYAADVVVEGLREFVKTTLSSPGVGPDETARRLTSAIRAAHRHLTESSRGQPWRGCGTTLTCSMLCGRTAVVAHVGDSRLFWRHADAWRLVTRDHTLLREHPNLPLPPELTEWERGHHANILTRALGCPDEPPSVDVSTFVVSPGDDLLLCTDGAWAPFDPGCVGALPPSLTTRRLLEWIFEQYSAAGEPDNATVVLAAVGTDSARTPAPELQSRE